MSIVCGLDLHRRQITFDAIDTVSGEVWRGRVWQPDRERFRRWLRHDVARRAGGEPVAMAVEGCTGWRYVVEEIVAAGFEAHLAEPADTQAARGRKRHAKTDRSDSRLLRELLQRGELPESWIPPAAVLDWRERVRLYKSLLDQRRVLDPADRRRVVPARRGAARGPDRRAVDPAVVGRRRRHLDSRRSPTDRRRLGDDRRHRHCRAAVEAAAATLRDASAGVPRAGRCPRQDRRADRGGGVVQAQTAEGRRAGPHEDSSPIRATSRPAT